MARAKNRKPKQKPSPKTKLKPKLKVKPRAKTVPKTKPAPKTKNALDSLVETVFRLRAPDGCPWDRAQTHQSLRPYLIEEAYELLDVLDQIKADKDLKTNPRLRADFREELGDVLLQVVLHAEMASQAGAFDIHDVAAGLSEKLIRRHPHVFAKAQGKNADAALANWENEKAKEKAERRALGKKAGASGAEGDEEDTSILSGLPRQLPALQRAARVIEKVTKVGFQWPNLDGPLEKVQEEIGELTHEIRAFEKDPSAKNRARLEAELGDVLFCVANLAFLLKIQPEDALRGNLERFEKRFRHVEKRLAENGRKTGEADLAEMDRYWDEAKKLEKKEF